MSGLHRSSDTGLGTNEASVSLQVHYDGEYVEDEQSEQEAQRFRIYRQYHESLRKIQPTPCEELQAIEEIKEKKNRLLRAIWRLPAREIDLAEDIFVNNLTAGQISVKHCLTKEEIDEKTESLMSRLCFLVKGMPDNEVGLVRSTNAQFCR